MDSETYSYDAWGVALEEADMNMFEIEEYTLGELTLPGYSYPDLSKALCRLAGSSAVSYLDLVGVMDRLGGAEQAESFSIEAFCQEVNEGVGE